MISCPALLVATLRFTDAFIMHCHSILPQRLFGAGAQGAGCGVRPRLPGGHALVGCPTCSTRTAAAFMPSSARGGTTTVACAHAHPLMLCVRLRRRCLAGYDGV